MSHQITPYPLRLPLDLRKLLEEKAIEGHRSLNAEIVARLEESSKREAAIEEGVFNRT